MFYLKNDSQNSTNKTFYASVVYSTTKERVFTVTVKTMIAVA